MLTQCVVTLHLVGALLGEFGLMCILILHILYTVTYYVTHYECILYIVIYYVFHIMPMH